MQAYPKRPVARVAPPPASQVIVRSFNNPRDARNALKRLCAAGFRTPDVGVVQNTGFGRHQMMSLATLSKRTARIGAWLFGGLTAMTANLADFITTRTAEPVPVRQDGRSLFGLALSLILYTSAGALLGWLMGRLTPQPQEHPAWPENGRLAGMNWRSAKQTTLYVSPGPRA